MNNSEKIALVKGRCFDKVYVFSSQGQHLQKTKNLQFF